MYVDKFCLDFTILVAVKLTYIPLIICYCNKRAAKTSEWLQRHKDPPRDLRTPGHCDLRNPFITAARKDVGKSL